MVCVVSVQEKPRLKNPVLIEGLPGIGFVANIAALHLIRELKANPFAEIRCSSFQDFAVTTEKGKPRHPINELYYYKGKEKERDLIILYGNTQALTTTGQYELCGRILDISKELGCRYVITLGGFKKEQEVLVGIGKLRGFRGFCLLAETLGVYPDRVATQEILKVVCDMLDLKVNIDNLADTVETTRDLLENFGLIDHSLKEKRKEESQFRWFI